MSFYGIVTWCLRASLDHLVLRPVPNPPIRRRRKTKNNQFVWVPFADSRDGIGQGNCAMTGCLCRRVHDETLQENDGKVVKTLLNYF